MACAGALGRGARRLTALSDDHAELDLKLDRIRSGAVLSRPSDWLRRSWRPILADLRDTVREHVAEEPTTVPLIKRSLRLGRGVEPGGGHHPQARRAR